MNRSKTIRTALILLVVVSATIGCVVFLTLQLVPLASEIVATQVVATPMGIPNADGDGMSSDTMAAAPENRGVPTEATEIPAPQILETNLTEPIIVPTNVPSTSPTDDVEIGPSAANSSGTGRRAIVTGAVVNVRSAPSVAGELLTQISQNQELRILATSEDNAWYRVCCPLGTVIERETWVSADLVRLLPNQTAPTETTDSVAAATLPSQSRSLLNGDSDSILGTVNATLVNVRSGPSTQFPVVGQVEQTMRLTVVGRTESGDWLQVCCLSTTNPSTTDETGWISANLLAFDGDRAAVLASVPTVPVPELPTPQPAAAASNAVASQLPTGSGPGLPGMGGFGTPGGTNPLTGLSFAGGQAGQRPVIVCMNNDPAARPQFGLSQADILYEYLMEGYGITRFSAIFYGEDVTQIGPVRSARLINYYMGALYDAGLLCSGASDQVRYTLKHEAPFPYLDIDLDDPANSRYSTSIGTDYRTRLRTSTGGAHRWLAEWGVERAPSIRSLTFGDSLDGGASAARIEIPYPSGTGSQVAYQYDGASGRYLRWLGGRPHADGNSGQQLAFDNVIVQYVVHEATDIIEDSLGSTSIRLNLFGSGQALVFRGGLGFAGTWRSESRGDLPRFYTDDGREISLKPGKSWISVVPSTYTVTYQ